MKAIAKRLKIENGIAIAFFDAYGDRKIIEQSRLFAVTQDIKVGDEVWQDIDPVPVIADKNHISWNEKVKKHRGLSRLGPYLKKFGPLSPNATWVKEGDKIEGKLIHKFVHQEGKEWKCITGWHPGSYEGAEEPTHITVAKFKDGQYINKKKVPVKVEWIFQVKCSQCNTYH